MPRTRNWNPQAISEVSQEAATGVDAQAASGTRSTVAFAANHDVIMGAPIVVVVKSLLAADTAYDAAGAVTTIGGTKPVLANKYRIIKIQTIRRALRTGGTPDHDLKVEVGDGAASESFTSVVATVDVDAETTLNSPVDRILVNSAATVWSTGRTLQCQQSVAGSTTTGTAEVDFIITMVPTNEAIS